jgi:hypothetical protein
MKWQRTGDRETVKEIVLVLVIAFALAGLIELVSIVIRGLPL